MIGRLPVPIQLRDSRASCASGCACIGWKPAQLRELRELRDFPLPHACACVRMCARTHGFTKSRATRATHATTRLFTYLSRNLSRNLRNRSRNHHHTTITMTENAKKGRVLMPVTAGLVDELRQMLGQEFVDAAIAAGQRARREYQVLEQQRGTEYADAWLRRQSFPQGAFFAEENGHSVGVRLL